jgi:hypothetical protein
VERLGCRSAVAVVASDTAPIHASTAGTGVAAICGCYLWLLFVAAICGCCLWRRAGASHGRSPKRSRLLPEAREGKSARAMACPSWHRAEKQPAPRPTVGPAGKAGIALLCMHSTNELSTSTGRLAAATDGERAHFKADACGASNVFAASRRAPASPVSPVSKAAMHADTTVAGDMHPSPAVRTQHAARSTQQAARIACAGPATTRVFAQRSQAARLDTGRAQCSPTANASSRGGPAAVRECRGS